MNNPVFFDFVGVIEEYHDSEGSETATVSDSSSSSSDSSSELELLSTETDNPLHRYIIANSLIVRARRFGEREQYDPSQLGIVTIADTVPVTNHSNRVWGTNYAHNDSEESETASVSDSSGNSSSGDSSSDSRIIRRRRTGEREQQQRTDDLSGLHIPIVDTVPVTNHAQRNRTHPPRTALFRLTRSVVHRLTRALRARASGFQIPQPRPIRGPFTAIPEKLHTKSPLSRRLREEHRLFMDEVRRWTAQAIINNNNRKLTRL